MLLVLQEPVKDSTLVVYYEKNIARPMTIGVRRCFENGLDRRILVPIEMRLVPVGDFLQVHGGAQSTAFPLLFEDVALFCRRRTLAKEVVLPHFDQIHCGTDVASIDGAPTILTRPRLLAVVSVQLFVVERLSSG